MVDRATLPRETLKLASAVRFADTRHASGRVEPAERGRGSPLPEAIVCRAKRTPPAQNNVQRLLRRGSGIACPPRTAAALNIMRWRNPRVDHHTVRFKQPSPTRFLVEYG